MGFQRFYHRSLGHLDLTVPKTPKQRHSFGAPTGRPSRMKPSEKTSCPRAKDGTVHFKTYNLPSEPLHFVRFLGHMKVTKTPSCLPNHGSGQLLVLYLSTCHAIHFRRFLGRMGNSSAWQLRSPLSHCFHPPGTHQVPLKQNHPITGMKRYIVMFCFVQELI